MYSPYPAKLIYLNDQPLEVASRYRDPQHQVLVNYSYVFNLRPNITKSGRLSTQSFPISVITTNKTE